MKHPLRIRLARNAALLLLTVVTSFTSQSRAAGIDYATTIQPIYNSLCISCHGNSKADAGLNVQSNSYANTVNRGSGKYGAYRIRPNFATTAQSAIYTVIVSQGSSANHNGGSWTASATQKTNLTNWIKQGALLNLSAPTVTSLSVTSGGTAGGTAVTINGTAFGGTSPFAPVVTFGGVPATSVVVTTGSFTKITCVTPAHAAGLADVVVTTTAGGASAPLTNGFNFIPGSPSKLAFTTQPSNAAFDGTISPAVVVQIQDSSGGVTTSTANVTLAINANPGSSTLSGTTTVAAVAGVATFDNLNLNRAGIGYTLSASSGALTGATSTTFNITGLAPAIGSPTSTAIATTSATLGGNITADNGDNVTARGVVLAPTSVNSNPVIGGTGVANLSAAAAGAGTFTVNASSLAPGTAYSFAAYATNSIGTSYTTVGSFTTISNNANLASLVPSSGTMAPPFSSGTISYSFTVPYTTSSLTITPTTAESHATVLVNGNPVTSGTASAAINLNVGSNTITCEVTAQDNTQKTYTLSITRTAASTNANLASLVPSTGTLAPVFDSATITYTLQVPYAVTTMSVTPTVADAFSTLQVNGSSLVSGTASSPVTLNEGTNTITTVVTAQNNDTKTYTLTVTREAEAASATLANLVSSAGTLSPVFDFATQTYTLSTTLETESVTLTPTLTTSIASVKINNVAVTDNTASAPITLNVGSNSITVVVTSQDTTNTTTYSITANRLPSANADLASLTPNVGTLAPVFASATTSYTLDVANTVTDISFTPVTAESHATIQFNGAALDSGSASLAMTLLEGDNAAQIVVTSQNGTPKTYSVNIRRAYKGAPRIVSQPASQTVIPATAVVFNVQAVGAEPLHYQWKRNNIAIVGATASSYAIASAQTSNAGSYTVLVSNAAGSVTSDIATLTVAAAGVVGLPQITAHPLSALVPLGSAATFDASATGAATLTGQWRKGTTVLATTTSLTGSLTATYTTPPTTLLSAGSYNLLAKNTKGSVASTSARLGVVNTANTTKLAKIGTTVTLTASAAGDRLIYQWQKDGVEIYDGAVGTHIVSGTGTASLTIKGSTTGDTGEYTCLVRMGSLIRKTGVITLKVYDLAPLILLNDNDTLPPGIVSGTYQGPSGYKVPVDQSNERAVVTFTQVGLPHGLSLDKVTGVITGKPTVASPLLPVPAPFKVTITATNGVSSDKVIVWLTVSALPTAAVGTFNGLADRDASLTSGLSLNAAKTLSFGGALNLTVTGTGVFSGKLVLGTSSYSFNAQVLDSVIGGNPTATVKLPTTGPTKLWLSLEIDKDTGELVNSSVSDHVAPSVAIQGWHHTAPSAGLIGSYTAKVSITPSQIPDPASDLQYPHGYGFGTLTVTAKGASWVGKLADGAAFTISSTTVGSTGKIPLHSMLYSNTGSAHGWVQITADSVASPTNAGQPLLDGSIDWVKGVQPVASTNHNYKPGFPLHQLTVEGGKYVSTPPLFGIQDQGLGTTNAKLTFAEGGLTGPAPIVGATTATDLNNTPFRLTSTNTLVLPAAAQNLATIKFTTWNAATGSFVGTALLKNDPDVTKPPAVLSRPVNFAGVLVTRLSVNKGIGYFLLSKLPELGSPNTTLLTSEILSGHVELGAK